MLKGGRQVCSTWRPLPDDRSANDRTPFRCRMLLLLLLVWMDAAGGAAPPPARSMMGGGGELLWSGAAVVPRAQSVDSVSAATLSSDHTPDCSRIYRTVSSTFAGKSSVLCCNCLKARPGWRRGTSVPQRIIGVLTPSRPVVCKQTSGFPRLSALGCWAT